MNKTSYYLGAAIKSNTEFAPYVSQMWEKGYIKSFYVDDKDYIAYGKENDCIFIVVKGIYGDKILNLKKDFIKDAYMVGEDYVLLVPVYLDNKNWKEDFLEGKYSKIFSDREKKKYLTPNGESFIKRNKVMNRELDYWEQFNENVYEMFGVRLEEIDDRELDFPPRKEEEIINYI